MHPQLKVPPLGPVARAMDTLIFPIMLLPGITPRGEFPQLTHAWNHALLPKSAEALLDPSLMVTRPGDPKAVRRRGRWDLRFHLGGWSRYAVLEVRTQIPWHIGWLTESGPDVSRIPIVLQVRMLIGPDETTFFALDRSGRQLKLRLIDEGRIGDGGRYRRLPLH